MKKSNFAGASPLTKNEMRKVTGGGFPPCYSECLTDNDCPVTQSGIRGWCQLVYEADCSLNWDGSKPELRYCVGG